MQEIHGQFSSLIAHTSGSGSRPLSPTVEFTTDSVAMPPSIEIVQILLDDWNKAQHQKLADIAGALTATEMMDSVEQDESARSQLALYAIRSFRYVLQFIRRIPSVFSFLFFLFLLICLSIHSDDSNSDDSDGMENGLENGKGCGCDTCSEREINHTVKK